MNRVDDRIAVVTGACGGIGAATCALLAAQGAMVVATDLHAEPGERLAAAIEAADGAIRYLRHDVTSDAQWRAVLDDATSAHGRIDVLVNNAGLFAHGRIEDLDETAMTRLFDVNLKGVVLGTVHAFRTMKTRPRELPAASIVNLSSIAGLRGAPYASLYCLTKGGVRLYTKASALEAAELGYRIRVNSVHPGIVDTDMARQVGEIARGRGVPADAIPQALAARHPLARLGEPMDVARAILYLASDDSAFVTGAETVVDGGATAR
jgi:NAD(P)-dependent dehydrogenase (short-subunit alcohol dehydrogenase family)